MDPTKINIQVLSRDVDFMQKKIIQVIRIKSKLDQRREKYISLLRTSGEFPDQEVLQKLWNTYNKEERLLGIIRKGIKNVENYEINLREILVDVGVLKHVWTKFRKKETDFTLKSIVILKYAFKKTRKYLNLMNSEFNRVEKLFLRQHQLLELIMDGRKDEIIVFIEEYDREIKTIKKFYKTGVNDVLIKVIRRMSPEKAAVIISMNLILPGPIDAPAISISLFGVQYGLILSTMIVILKYLSIAGYTAYSLRKE